MRCIKFNPQNHIAHSQKVNITKQMDFRVFVCVCVVQSTEYIVAENKRSYFSVSSSHWWFELVP